MSSQFQAYQDENSVLLGQPTGENLKPLPGFGGGKRALSGSRRALGNITNNNGGVQSAKQAVSREVSGDPRERETNTGPTTSTSGRKGTHEAACIDELMRGGVERSAGMGWDEQQALREMELMDAGVVDVAGHDALLRARVAGLCKSVQGTEEARRREAIDAAIYGFGDDSEIVEGMRDELAAPSSPTQALCVLEELEDVLP